MKNLPHLLIACFMFFSCQAQKTPTHFSEKALNDTFMALEGKSVTFKTILETHKGKTILIDVWASWCKDCIEGMPKVKVLQKDYNDVVYVFLSLDKSVESWKKGVDRYKVEGEHYFMQSGWNGDFGTFLNLDWIPRYLVVDKTGKIAIYRAIKADDQQIKQALK